MDLQTELQWVHNELDKVKDPEVVALFKRLLELRKQKGPQSLADYNREIEAAEKDIETGALFTVHQLRESKEKWKNTL